MNKIIKKFLENLTFRRQLGIMITLGILLLALSSSLVGSWQSNERVRANLLDQGKHITENLARQSVLALLFASPDNAGEAVKSTMAFPGVVGLEIRDAKKHVLLTRGSANIASSKVRFNPANSPASAVLDQESGDVWRFVAPVYTQPSFLRFTVQCADGPTRAARLCFGSDEQGST